ncbi:MAG: hypothetical protein ACK4SY_05650 [Pyrobaculum sp.]
MARRAYIQGLAQRRVKYRIDLRSPKPLGLWIEEDLPKARELIASEWGGALCPSPQPPTVGLLLVKWRGATLPADISICAPISHPTAPYALDVYIRRVDICLEPIAPTAPPAGYISLHIPTVKHVGRVTLRGRHAVVKHRGLLFVVEALYSPEARGGVDLKLARYGCFHYQLGKALRLMKKILREEIRGGGVSPLREGKRGQDGDKT